jgi:hypothetical protein
VRRFSVRFRGTSFQKCLEGGIGRGADALFSAAAEEPAVGNQQFGRKIHA